MVVNNSLMEDVNGDSQSISIDNEQSLDAKDNKLISTKGMKPFEMLSKRGYKQRLNTNTRE